MARPSRKPWPARTIAASAFSASGPVGATSAKGPIRRRWANRSAAATASVAAACSRAPRRPPRRFRRPQRLATRAARRSRAPVSDRALQAKPASSMKPCSANRRPAPRGRRAVPVPAALADLAVEIGGELRPSGRETRRHRAAQARCSALRRAACAAAGPSAVHCAQFVPHSTTISNPARSAAGSSCRAIEGGSSDQGEGLLDRNDTIEPTSPRRAPRRPSTACRGASPTSPRSARRSIMPRRAAAA